MAAGRGRTTHPPMPPLRTTLLVGVSARNSRPRIGSLVLGESVTDWGIGRLASSYAVIKRGSPRAGGHGAFPCTSGSHGGRRRSACVETGSTCPAAEQRYGPTKWAGCFLGGDSVGFPERRGSSARLVERRCHARRVPRAPGFFQSSAGITAMEERGPQRRVIEAGLHRPAGRPRLA